MQDAILYISNKPDEHENQERQTIWTKCDSEQVSIPTERYYELTCKADEWFYFQNKKGFLLDL